jgi:hypothetical protein
VCVCVCVCVYVCVCVNMIARCVFEGGLYQALQSVLQAAIR